MLKLYRRTLSAPWRLVSFLNIYRLNIVHNGVAHTHPRTLSCIRVYTHLCVHYITRAIVFFFHASSHATERPLHYPSRHHVTPPWRPFNRYGVATIPVHVYSSIAFGNSLSIVAFVGFQSFATFVACHRLPARFGIHPPGSVEINTLQRSLSRYKFSWFGGGFIRRGVY